MKPLWMCGALWADCSNSLGGAEGPFCQACAKEVAAARPRIEVLRSEAGAAGDLLMVSYCDRALAGNTTAQQVCMQALGEARAMHD